MKLDYEKPELIEYENLNKLTSQVPPIAVSEKVID
jgi:hypothetical protein